MADEFAYEQPDQESYKIDHPYSLINLKNEKLSDRVPLNYNEVMSSKFAKEWKKAMHQELSSLYENDINKPDFFFVNYFL